MIILYILDTFESFVRWILSDGFLQNMFLSLKVLAASAPKPQISTVLLSILMQLFRLQVLTTNLLILNFHF